MMDKRYYFDHNATTPVRPEVVEAMLPYLTERFGNASSIHSFGREAREALEESRRKIAGFLNARPGEFYFTGCGTESDNIALAGVLQSAREGKNALVTTAIEHSAIINTGKVLEERGFKVTFVGVDHRGVVDLDALRKAVGPETALVSVMQANNETGVLQPIHEAARIAHERGALFHTDAVQSAGKVPIDVVETGIDLLTMSAHKLNALKGVGGIYIRKEIPITPLMYGGHHEHGIRPGTENVPGAVGFARAVELAVAHMKDEARKLSALRDRLEKSILDRIPDVVVNGFGASRLANTTNISFPGVDGEALLMSLDLAGVALSTGSACTIGEVEPSHVLLAMGVNPRTATSSLRFSMGWGTTGEGIDHIIEALPPIVERLRRVSGGIAGGCSGNCSCH
ncbi:MAG: cysteine desulfurase family protein [Candidatus Latescibacterota bacterium]